MLSRLLISFLCLVLGTVVPYFLGRIALSALEWDGFHFPIRLTRLDWTDSVLAWLFGIAVSGLLMVVGIALYIWWLWMTSGACPP